MARRSDHTREELKEMILKTSWDIIGKDGFEGLTARKIANKIGYAPGTIYNLFTSMEDLYIAINGQTLDLLYKVLSCPECNDTNNSISDNVKKTALLYREFIQGYRPYWLMLFTHSIPDDMQAPDWYLEKVKRLFSPLEVLLQPLFTNKKTGDIKKAARVLWSSIHGLLFLEGTGKIPLITNNETAIEMTNYLVDNFMSGIENT